jgi:hypothetical protein
MIPLETAVFSPTHRGSAKSGSGASTRSSWCDRFPTWCASWTTASSPIAATRPSQVVPVRKAVGAEIIADRYESYLLFLDEIESLPEDWE